MPTEKIFAIVDLEISPQVFEFGVAHSIDEFVAKYEKYSIFSQFRAVWIMDLPDGMSLELFEEVFVSIKTAKDRLSCHDTEVCQSFVEPQRRYRL